MDIAILVILFISRKFITNPLKKLILAFEKISTGDLNISFGEEVNRKDEIGCLTNSLKNAAENTRVLIKESINNSDELNDGSYMISTSAQKLAGDVRIVNNSVMEIFEIIEDNSAATEEINASSEEIVSTSMEISFKAKNANDTAIKIKEFAEELSHLNFSSTIRDNRKDEFGETIESLNKAQNNLRSMSKELLSTIQEVSASVEEIDSSINELSSKALDGSNNANQSKERPTAAKNKSRIAIYDTRRIYA